VLHWVAVRVFHNTTADDLSATPELTIRSSWEGCSVRPIHDVCAELRDLKGSTPTHHRFHGRLLALALITLAIYLLAIIIVWLVPDSGLEGWKALVWTASQMIAGGSSLNAQSGWVHAFGVVLQLWAVFAIAALAGSFGAFFHRRGLERDPLQTAGAAAEPT
jgi:hypothetical protein